MEKYDICVYGGSSLDRTFISHSGHYSKFPNLESLGGKGANQAVACKRAGASVAFITKLGNDEIGKVLENSLSLYNFDKLLIEKVDSKSDYSNVYVDANGDNYLVRHNHAIKKFVVQDIYTYQEIFKNCKLILIQNKFKKEIVNKLINFCYENNIRLILTPSSPTKIDYFNEKDKFNKVYKIVANKYEALTITKSNSIQEAILKQKNMIVTDGANGAYYFEGEVNHLECPYQKFVIDTTGAGDVFCGTLSAKLVKGYPLESCIKYALYSASNKVKYLGAQM